MHISPAKPQPSRLARWWQTGLVLGVGTLILGIVVALNPTGSLTLIAVLLGVLILVSGVYYLIRALDANQPHRFWPGLAGVFFVAAGVVLIVHPTFAKSIIALLVAAVWIAQGVVALAAATGRRPGQGRAWWVAFGLLSIIAGVVVLAAPLSSLTALAILFGVWFGVMGLLEIGGALILRHSLHVAARGTF